MCSLCQIIFVVQLEIDGPGSCPVAPRLLQDRGEPRLQGLEPEDDEGPVVDVVTWAEGIVGLNPLHFLIHAWKRKREEMNDMS